MQVSQPLGGCLPRRFPALLPHPHPGSAHLPPPALASSSSPATAPAAAWAIRQQQMPGAKICILRPRRTPEDESRTPRRARKEGTGGAAVPPKRQQPPPPREGSAPTERLPAAVAAAAGGPLSPTMPGPATGGGKVPFRNAKEEIRAGVEGPEGGGAQERPGARGQQQNIVWRNVVLMSLLHLGAVYSLVLIPKAKPLTLLWAYLCFLLTALGVTAGAHRLWSHRSYKAKLPLRIFLAAANSMAFQNDIFEWSRDHRVHHKYSETDADPHNARRGFFFSHIGWLFVRKHRDVIEKGRKLDVTDLLADPVVRFQRKYYKITVVLMCFVLPTLVPWYIWGESLWNSYFLASILRYTISLNVTWLVNSAAHMYGNRPYDKHISPRQNPFVTVGAIGEGFHNYHHTFPFDYSTSEFGLNFNPTTWFIDFMCWLGLATDRKRATKPMIEARKARTGDGSA